MQQNSSHKHTHLMGLRHVLGHAAAHIVWNVRYACQEALRHAEQGLMRPAVEPVQLGAVDERRELARPDAELVADRTEAQDHMQVAADLHTHAHAHAGVSQETVALPPKLVWAWSRRE